LKNLQPHGGGIFVEQYRKEAAPRATAWRHLILQRSKEKQNAVVEASRRLADEG